MVRGSCCRVGRASLLVPFLLVAITLLPGPADLVQAAEAQPFRLIAADASGVTLEYAAPEPVISSETIPFGVFQRIEMAGHRPLIELGMPALPGCGAGLAIPEGARPRLSWEILEQRDLPGLRPLPAPEGPSRHPETILEEEGFAIDEAWYVQGGPWPESQVSYGETGHLRSHRVGQVSVCPIQWDPATGVATFIKRARIRLDFAPAGPGRPSGPGADPGLDVPGGSVPVGEEPAWEDTYRRAFLNYESARAFRVRRLPGIERSALESQGSGLVGPGPAAAGGPAAPLAASPSATNPEFRIYVGTTGLCSATYADLAAAGWPAGVPSDRIHLYEKSYNAANPSQPLIREVPIRMVDTTGVAGTFDADDNFYFYGLNYQDRFNPQQVIARFTRLHAYWLTWTTEAGARMQQAPGWHDAPSFTTPTSFTCRTHWERDLLYTYIRAAGSTSGIDLPQDPSIYWLGPAAYVDSLDFYTPGRDASRPFRVRAQWLGVFAGVHYASVWIGRGCTAVSDTLLVYKTPMGSQGLFTYDSGPVVPGTRLSDGCNWFKIQGNGFVEGDPNSPGSGAYFDWFEVNYSRRYTASGGVLRFTSDKATGNVEFAIRGLDWEFPLVFDVTDSLAPQMVDLSGATWTDLGTRPKEYELRFRAAVSRQRTYVLYKPSAVPLLGNLVTAMPPDLGTKNVAAVPPRDVVTDTGADVLVIAHPQFQGELSTWLTLRQSQGHRITMVSPQQIWDQFSGGDKSIPAIRDWLRWVYRNWATSPDYVLFFGDASEDYRKDLITSKPDWVPTMMRFGPVPDASHRYELIGSDNWYVGSLGDSDASYDVLPDMHAGRLSVGSVEQARDVVAKLVAYDNYSSDDAWRNRGLIVSDDFHSSPLLGGEQYCYRSDDKQFEAGGDSLASLFARKGCFAGFELEHFKLRDIMNADSIALGRADTLGNCPASQPCVDHVKAVATPAWLAACNRGQLFQIFAGHGNRTLMTTEHLVEYVGRWIHPDSRTPDQLANYGKPFVFIGLSCHLNEYEHVTESDYLASVAERMLLLPRGGAIASIASTGFEWISINRTVEVYMGRVLFIEHPRDDTGHPRRILGEGFDQSLLTATVDNAVENPGFRDTFESYCLLGDPTMRIDMAPPRLEVAVDGVPKASGDRIFPSAEPATITARISDDVDYQGGGFSITEGDSLVPASAYTVAPYDDAREGACRGMEVTWSPELQMANYAIVLRATDWLNREMEFTLNVKSVDVSYRLGSPASGNGSTEITGDEIIPTDGRLEIVATSLIALSPGDFEARVNGDGGYFAWAASPTEENTWIGTPTRDLPLGRITLDVLVRGRQFDTRVLRTEDRVLITEVYFYPSPWEGKGPGRFTYQLAFPARGESPTRTRVSVFSVSGRRVVALEGPAGVGRNALAWDMRDQQGDEVANGVYLYKLVVDFPSGRNLTTIDRLVVHR